jgi:hypothetical protein
MRVNNSWLDKVSAKINWIKQSNFIRKSVVLKHGASPSGE